MKKILLFIALAVTTLAVNAANTNLLEYTFAKHLGLDEDDNDIWDATSLAGDDGVGTVVISSGAQVDNSIATTWAYKITSDTRYMTVKLAEALQEGDRVLINMAANTSSAYASTGVGLAATKDDAIIDGTTKLCSANKTFEDVIIDVPAELVGAKQFTILRNPGNSPFISKVVVYRPGETSNKVTWNFANFPGTWASSGVNEFVADDGEAVLTMKTASADNDILVVNDDMAVTVGTEVFNTSTTWGGNSDGTKRYLTLKGIGGTGKLNIIFGGKSADGAGKDNKAVPVSIRESAFDGKEIASVKAGKWVSAATGDVELDAAKTYYLTGADFRCVAGIIWEKSAEAKPADASISGAKVCKENDEVILTASASGNPLPTFQWYTTDEAGENLVAIEGATSNKYTVDTSKKGTYYYTFVATNSLGSVTADAFSVEIAESSRTVENNLFVITAANESFVNGYEVLAEDYKITFGNDINGEWSVFDRSEDKLVPDNVTLWEATVGKGGLFKYCVQCTNTNPSPATAGSAPSAGGYYKVETYNKNGGYINLPVQANNAKATFVTQVDAEENAADFAYYLNGEVQYEGGVTITDKFAIIAFPNDGKTYYVFTNGSKISLFGAFLSETPANDATDTKSVVAADNAPVKAVKVLDKKNGQIMVGNYNVAGQQMK